MLNASPVMTMIRTADVAKQAHFYAEILGLRIAERAATGEVYLEAGGGTKIGLYAGEPPRADHTLACFAVEDLPAAVHQLEGQGIATTPSPDGRCAFFRDPDGNWLAIGSR